ncbi:hypothetical protein M9H77_09186 [Catharanthus roseus]|uniref:Uncharacterized protein n=1 Tax=Catharanthus roseus TaxID=4058 RepID=A0ACC0C0B1_CATRO|nr:hypothetical protein M9H77_09186 [Catharanthus roseus]
MRHVSAKHPKWHAHASGPIDTSSSTTHNLLINMSKYDNSEEKWFLVFSASIYKTRKSSASCGGNLSDDNEAPSSLHCGYYQFLFLLPHRFLQFCWSRVSRSSLSPFTKQEIHLQLSASAVSGGNPSKGNEAPSSPQCGLYQLFFYCLIIFSVDLSDQNPTQIFPVTRVIEIFRTQFWIKDEVEGFCDFLGKRKRLASGVLPNRPTGRKSVMKRIKPDLNSCESENKAVSNSFERETVATLLLR